MDVNKVYQYALMREREGRDFFAENAERVHHAAAQGIFRNLVEEEKRHIQYIERQIAMLAGTGGTTLESELGAEGFFAQRAESEMLDQTVIESMIPDVTILRMAYLIERDLAEFYEMAARRAEGEAQQALISLAQWEREHERLFKALHDRVFEEYVNMPWGG